jgi:hypothetical protein
VVEDGDGDDEADDASLGRPGAKAHGSIVAHSRSLWLRATNSRETRPYGECRLDGRGALCQVSADSVPEPEIVAQSHKVRPG